MVLPDSKISRIGRPLFFVLCNAVVITVMQLLALDHAIRKQEFDSTVTFNAIFLLVNISANFIFCQFAENLAIESMEMANIVYSDLLWYKLSLRQQKIFVLP